MGRTLLPHTPPDKEAQAGTVSQLVVLLALLGRTVAKHTPTYVLLLRSDWPTNQSANPRRNTSTSTGNWNPRVSKDRCFKQS